MEVTSTLARSARCCPSSWHGTLHDGQELLSTLVWTSGTILHLTLQCMRSISCRLIPCTERYGGCVPARDRHNATLFRPVIALPSPPSFLGHPGMEVVPRSTEAWVAQEPQQVASRTFLVRPFTEALVRPFLKALVRPFTEAGLAIRTAALGPELSYRPGRGRRPVRVGGHHRATQAEQT